MHERVPELLERFSRVEFERVCLLGMGGSSLAPEVLKRLFRVDTFETLDTTHPSAVRRVETDGTLFISASKSGSTLETRSHTEYFLEQVGTGDRFVAITDPGSELERLASERGFFDTIHGEPTIGGRYSALSPFGIVPAVLMGIDAHRLLDRAEEMREACRLDVGNPGLELGLELGAGPDKVLVEGDFGLWVEQLLAESTGKHGKGLVPVRYGDTDEVQRPDFRVDDPYEVAQEFFRWEFATAVAGSILGINPFDQPDVQAAKDKTNELLSRGGAPSVEPEGDLDELLAGAREGDYVAILAFIDPARESELAPLVDRARATGRPVSVGLGPRYLHSTGQLHKGGPDTGLFVQVVDDLGEELPIPGQPFGFRTLIAAQAAGDFEALKERGRRAVQSDAVKLGMIGLGRMGSGMTERLRRDGHEVMTYDPNVESTAESLAELATQLESPRVFWMMVPAGEITESTFRESLEVLEEGDVLVDGGNSYFRDSIRRHDEAKEHGVRFVDVGVSGGVWGLEVGFCLMAGGDDDATAILAPAFDSLAPENGWADVGGPGSGHYVKMVHNGIEYGLMEAYAEGFELMKHSQFDLDLEQIAGIWRYGSVVRSWLLDLLYEAFKTNGSSLEKIAPYVEDSGEGRWTINEAINQNVPVPAIASALFARFASRDEINFGGEGAGGASQPVRRPRGARGGRAQGRP